VSTDFLHRSIDETFSEVIAGHLPSIAGAAVLPPEYLDDRSEPRTPVADDVHAIKTPPMTARVFKISIPIDQPDNRDPVRFAMSQSVAGVGS
jgi:hypothetical protein